MVARFLIEVVDRLRSMSRELDALVLFAVEDTHRVREESFTAVLTELALLSLEITDERLLIVTPRLRRPDTVYLEFDILETELTDDSIGELDGLGIDDWIIFPKDIKVGLPVLAIAALLRTVIAKDGAHSKEFDRLGKDTHPVLDISATQSGGHLRTEGDAITATSVEKIDLFVEDISPLTDGAEIEMGKLYGRQVDTLKTILL